MLLIKFEKCCHMQNFSLALIYLFAQHLEIVFLLPCYFVFIFTLDSVDIEVSWEFVLYLLITSAIVTHVFLTYFLYLSNSALVFVSTFLLFSL